MNASAVKWCTNVRPHVVPLVSMSSRQFRSIGSLYSINWLNAFGASYVEKNNKTLSFFCVCLSSFCQIRNTLPHWRWVLLLPDGWARNDATMITSGRSTGGRPNQMNVQVVVFQYLKWHAPLCLIYFSKSESVD